MCSVNAACVGGKPSISLHFWVKSCFLASFILKHSWLLDESYSKTTTLSSGQSHCWIFFGVELAAKAQNTGGTTLYVPSKCPMQCKAFIRTKYLGFFVCSKEWTIFPTQRAIHISARSSHWADATKPTTSCDVQHAYSHSVLSKPDSIFHMEKHAHVSLLTGA